MAVASDAAVLTAIEAKTRKADDNGCLLWSGILSDKGSPLLYIIVDKTRHQIHVQRFLWNIRHPGQHSMDASHVCQWMCGNQRCVNVEHLRRAPRKKSFDPAAVWTKLVTKHGVRQENGCLMADTEYKSILLRGVSVKLHQAAFMIHHNLQVPPPDRNEDGNRMVIRHTCFQACCFEPTHLVYGTHSENCYEDKIANGTLRTGSAHYRASITEDLAREIMASKPTTRPGQEGHVTRQQRARRFGVSEDVVHGIDRGTSWAHMSSESADASAKRRAKARALQARSKARMWTTQMYTSAF